MSDEERDPTKEALEAQLGEPVEASCLALPVGGWKPTMFASLMRAFKGSRDPSLLKIAQYNVIAVTGTRVTCFAAAFERRVGLAPKQQLVDWPRGDVQGSATREESTTATMYGDGDVGPNNTTKLVRLTLRAGGQSLQADLSDDDATEALLDALEIRVGV